MKRVKVNRQELIATIKANMENHEKEYNVAFQEYIEAGEAAIKDLLAEFTTDPANTQLHIGLSAPVSHVEEYQDAIKILEASCEDEIELEQQDMNSLLLNKWHWVGDLGHTRAVYANFLKVKK